MYARSVEERERVALDGKGKVSVGKTVCPKFWQRSFFRLLAGDHFVPTFGRRPFLFRLLAGDRLFRLLAGDHFVPSFGRRPFVPTFGRRPFCSNFWQETVLFHLLAGDHFVPSFGRGPFCSIFWQGTVLFHLLAGDRFVLHFLSGTPNVGVRRQRPSPSHASMEPDKASTMPS